MKCSRRSSQLLLVFGLGAGLSRAPERAPTELCIADVYDALTTTRSYRPAMPMAEALPIMEKSRHWWREDVYAAFMSSVAVE